MSSGKDAVSPFSDDEQMSNMDEDLFSKLDTDGDGVVREGIQGRLRHRMGKTVVETVVIEKKSMNWSHFGIGIGITFGNFLLFGFVSFLTDSEPTDASVFLCNPCFVMPVVAIAAAVKGMPHVATGIGSVFMAGVVLFLGFCALIMINGGFY